MQCQIVSIENRGGTRFVTVSVGRYDLDARLTLPAPKNAPIYVGGTWRIGLTEAIKPVPSIDPACPPEPDECSGHGRGGKGAVCCHRAGEYNGLGSDGPLIFTCPKGCSCHD
jgi:hypothetical protein